MTKNLLKITFLFFFITSFLNCNIKDSTIPKIVNLKIKNTTVVAETAFREGDIARGLMFRTTLGTNEGMLFIFQTDTEASFWMKNTSIPLSIAFINKKKKIIKIDDMQPFDVLTHHRPGLPFKYALEVNQGFFRKHNIEPGNKVNGIPDIKR